MRCARKARARSGSEMRYTNNQFHETTFGDRVYVHARLASGGVSATGMNTIKSNSGNTRQTSAPVAGTLLAAPSVAGTGAPGAAGSFLHYAWSGRLAALDGQALPAKSGIVPAGPGVHTLVVDGQQVASLTLGVATCPKKGACLAAGRFEVRVPGARLLTQEADTAFFSLPGGATLAVQVLDRRDKNGHFWCARTDLTDLTQRQERSGPGAGAPARPTRRSIPWRFETEERRERGPG